MNANELNYRRNAGTVGFSDQEVLDDVITPAAEDLVRNNGVAIVLAAMAKAVIQNRDVAEERAEGEAAFLAAADYTDIADALERLAAKASDVFEITRY